MKNMVVAVMGVDRKNVVATPTALSSTRTMHLKEAEIGNLGQCYSGVRLGKEGGSEICGSKGCL